MNKLLTDRIMIGLAATTRGTTTMNKMQRTESVMTISRPDFRKQIIASGGTKKQADQMYREARQQETWANELYVAQIDRDTNHALGKLDGGMFELTVRRQDREPIFDWRHLQQMKNQLIGPENEMVQIFPAESRLRDSANQYWFYGFNSPAIPFPFGMFGRYVDDGNDHGKSKQRPRGKNDD